MSGQAYVFSIAALACIAVACSDDAKPAATVNGGTLVISVGGEPETLLPVLASTTPSQIIGDLVFDRLAEIGDSLNTVGDAGFKPSLARKWTWANDSMSIAFTIDSMAKWHDGKRVTSSDVRFTFGIYRDSATGSPFAEAVKSIDSVSTPDGATAVFWFSERSPNQFYDAVSAMSVLPEHVVGTARGAALRASTISRAPIGSGRFRFEKWNAAQSISLVADTANYRGRPRLDRVVMTISPDFTTALTRVVGGEADMLEQVPAASLADVSKDTSLRITLEPGLDYNFVQLNTRDPKHRSRPHPLFGDRALRRALTAALDRKSIVRNAYDSLAQVAVGPTVRAYPTTDGSLRQILYSPDAARKALDSLGWRDTNNDGVRDKNGKALEFSLAVPGSSKSRSTMAVLIQEQLKGVGVKVNIDPLDFAAFIDRENRRDFDAVFGGWHVEPSPGGIRQTWGTAGSKATGGSNYGSYENASFDAQVDSALASPTFAARRTHFTSAYQMIIDDAPAIWFAEPKRIMAVHRRFDTKGVRPDAWWANIADWSIPVDKRIARDRIGTAR